MKRRVVSALGLLAACARPLSAPSTRALNPVAARETTSDATPTAALRPWVVTPAEPLPVPVTALASVSSEAVLVLAAGSAWRLDATGQAHALCPERGSSMAGFEALASSADGRHAVLVSGTAFDPNVWTLETLTGRCTPLEVPGLMVRDASAGALRVHLAGDRVAVWSVGGALATGDLSGAPLRRQPSLPGLAAVALTATHTVALARVDPTGRHRLWGLDTNASTWRPVPGGDDLHAPVALAVAQDGSVWGLDARRRFEVGAEGLVATARLPGAFETPSVVAVSPSGLRGLPAPDPGVPTLGAAGSVVPMGVGLGWWTAGGVVGLPMVPTMQPVVAVAVDATGHRWTTDGREVFRADPDPAAPWVEITTRPLATRRPVAFAALGNRLLVVAASGEVAQSDDGGRRWSRSTLPREALPVLAAGLSPTGGAAVVSARVWARFEGDTWTTRPLPTRPRRVLVQQAQLFPLGDRWVLVDGVVLTSDDDGANWALRFGTLADPSASPDETTTESSPRAATTALAPDGSLRLLDVDGHLWHSRDGASHFVRDADRPLLNGTEGAQGPPRLVTDGAHFALLYNGALLADTRPARDALFVPTFFTHTLRGVLLAATAQDARVGSVCGGVPGEVLMMHTGVRWRPIADACRHRGVAFAQDGDTLVVLRPDGAIARRGLNDLARETLDRGP